MQLSLLFRVVLVLGLVAVLLGAECPPAQGIKGKKKKGKSNAPALSNKRNHRGSREKMRKLWISVDPAVIDFPDSAPVPPRRPISPWTYEAYYDESRIPNLIFQAKCERTGCMTEDGNEDYGLKSTPVYYQILVIRRVKGKNNKYSFQLEKMTVSVGCTCVKPIVFSQKE